MSTIQPELDWVPPNEESEDGPDSADAIGIKILCSVLTFPNTLSAKLLSISAGKGSRAPKSPIKSSAAARICSERRRTVLRLRKPRAAQDEVLERESRGEKVKCGEQEAMERAGSCRMRVCLVD
ncbi:Holliday junction ATP-dependent DNA helicaseRuvB [Striga asiatica]|uniref:Holliday junction ATP-dependent DNA helicaseRuvB n=1 Tax=Striga asiatica TaxID=4170 RepID=A0A5A7R0M6_STRAF|nr:Holliday junction ATP-dependent DNA helicaseRuvB [Striga asiatica]